MVKNYRLDAKMAENVYCSLASAIIIQAAKDYRDARRILNKKPCDLQAKLKMKSVVCFLESQWYEELTNLDGTTLLRRLEEESA